LGDPDEKVAGRKNPQGAGEPRATEGWWEGTHPGGSVGPSRRGRRKEVRAAAGQHKSAPETSIGGAVRKGEPSRPGVAMPVVGSQ